MDTPERLAVDNHFVLCGQHSVEAGLVKLRLEALLRIRHGEVAGSLGITQALTNGKHRDGLGDQGVETGPQFSQALREHLSEGFACPIRPVCAGHDAPCPVAAGDHALIHQPAVEEVTPSGGHFRLRMASCTQMLVRLRVNLADHATGC